MKLTSIMWVEQDIQGSYARTRVSTPLAISAFGLWRTDGT